VRSQPTLEILVPGLPGGARSRGLEAATRSARTVKLEFARLQSEDSL
jgi:hypothetical protein